MAAVLLRCALACLLSSCAPSSGEIVIHKFTEVELYNSGVWRDGTTRLVLLSETASYPADYIQSLESFLSNTTCLILQVTSCAQGEPSELCALLLMHPAVVRTRTGVLRGVQARDKEEKGAMVPVSVEEFLDSILCLLIHPPPTHISSFSEHTQFHDLNPKHFLVLSHTHSQHYFTLLSALLSLETVPHPLVITTTAGSLPLIHRPPHSRSAPPLNMWFISGPRWSTFPVCREVEVFGKELKMFVERTLHPAVMEYPGRSAFPYADTPPPPPVSLAYVFYPSHLGDDYLSIAEALAASHFFHFLFVTVERGKHSELEGLYNFSVPSEKPYIVIVPYNKPSGLHLLSPDHVPFSADQLKGILDSVVRDLYQPGAPEGREGEGLAPPTDQVTVGYTEVEQFVRISQELTQKGSILTCFCQKGSSDCRQCGGKLEKIANTLTNLGGEDLHHFAVFIVEYVTADELASYGVNTLPSFSLYSHHHDQWTHLATTASVAQLLTTVLGRRGLTASEGEHPPDVHDTSRGSGPGPPDTPPEFTQQPPDTPRSPPTKSRSEQAHPHWNPLEEDDHFGQLLNVVPPAEVPSELELSEETFPQYVAQHKRTVVVFYMKWDVRSQIFLHHFMAAVDALDFGKFSDQQDARLALVSCGDHNRLCSTYDITSYPSVRVFHGSVEQWDRYSGILDSRYLLELLGQHTEGELLKELVQELRPDTLPSILHGNLTAPLVLWCTKSPSTRPSSAFIEVAAQTELWSSEPQLVFAWIDGTKHSRLLGKLIESELELPTVLLVDFQQYLVYQLDVQEVEDIDLLHNKLQSFLKAYSDGTLEAIGTLHRREWSPVQPPIHFPSSFLGEEEEEEGLDRMVEDEEEEEEKEEEDGENPSYPKSSTTGEQKDSSFVLPMPPSLPPMPPSLPPMPPSPPPMPPSAPPMPPSPPPTGLQSNDPSHDKTEL